MLWAVRTLSADDIALHQDLVEESLTRDEKMLERGEVGAELVVGGGFVVAAVLCALLLPQDTGGDAADALICLVSLAAASRARFDVGPGFTLPVQLVFVPTLFLVSPAFVPLVTCAGLALGRATDVLARRSHAARLALVPGNSWFAIGPALVFAAAGMPQSDGEAALVVTIAVVSQFAGDFAASLLRERMIHGLTVREQLADAAWVYAVDVALTPVGLLAAFAVRDRPWALLLLLPLLGLMVFFSSERRGRLKGLVELSSAYRGTAMVLGDVVEADDGYTGEHSRGVVALALDVAEELGLSADQRRNVEFGALLHDVGKVCIPKDIINKPGRLDDTEWAIVRTHTVQGQQLLDRVGGSMSDVGRIVRSHHERWDGRGYPDGLMDAEIPLEARIIAACDTYNAMTTTRTYREALPPARAVEELRRCAGTQFDPDVVEALLRVLGEA
jgi:putative nucleotidyltransferase with HDIG domain